jgi:hypothetical protein
MTAPAPRPVVRILYRPKGLVWPHGAWCSVELDSREAVTNWERLWGHEFEWMMSDVAADGSVQWWDWRV